MITIIFEAHSTTLDNETRQASGFYDVELSKLGVRQSFEMGQRYSDSHFDAIFCSDLQRSYKTAKNAFGDKFPIIKDARLRECNYGDLTSHPKPEVDTEKLKRIGIPFPNGESYTQTCARMCDFLKDLSPEYDGKTIMIIGHRATQYGLEHYINKVPIINIVTIPWSYQPGWKYLLNNE